MELTDERILAVRKMWDGAHTAKAADIVAICDMALAHNAAKRQEPVAWTNEHEIREAQDKSFGMLGSKTDEFNVPVFLSPPDLAAKLKEARETIQFMIEHSEERGMSADAYEKAHDFLARTK